MSGASSESASISSTSTSPRIPSLIAWGALTATTVNNARVLREADQVGRLAPGMLADFIVVDGDPVADVGVLLKPGAVEAVYLGGRRVELALPTGMRRYPWERGHRQWGEIYDRDRVAHLRATGAQGPLPRRES